MQDTESDVQTSITSDHYPVNSVLQVKLGKPKESNQAQACKKFYKPLKKLQGIS